MMRVNRSWLGAWVALALALLPGGPARAGPGTALIPSAGIPQPTRPGDIVGLVLQNLGGTATPVMPLTFGEVFKPGALMPDDQLMLDAGKLVPVQMDPRTYNSDGSVAMATLTAMAPPLPARTATGAMLVRAPAHAPAPAAAVDLAGALARYSLSVVLDFERPDGTTRRITVDGVKAVQEGLGKSTASYWRRGPEASEALVDVPVRGSFRLVFDITAFANGTFLSDVRFDNDIAMEPHGGTVTYSEQIVQDGRTVSRQSDITQYQYQDWHTVVGTAASSADVNIQHDIGYLEATGAIPNFDLRLGVVASLLTEEAAIMAKPGWRAPLSANFITKSMPAVGGRPDIGLTTAWNAAWLMTQNPIAARFALGQADAAGSVPWHFFYLPAGAYLTTQDIPTIWIVASIQRPFTATPLTQPLTLAGGWRVDPAHQPDLSYVAYLLTGSEYNLDQLNAQAAWCETMFWPAPQARNWGQGLVVQGNQVRAAAWSLREIVEAAYANPPGSAMERYFRQMENNNFSWLISQIPAWTANEGQAYGYIPGLYGSRGSMGAWEQDFLASTVVLAAEQGDQQAVTFLKWESNFLVGRFLNRANGFNPRDGVAYNIFTYDPHTGRTYKTWAEIEQATEAAGGSNGNGWKRSNGYYAQLGLASLAGIITVTGSEQAREAYRWLLGSGAPFIDPVSRATWPQFAIVPLRDRAMLSATR